MKPKTPSGGAIVHRCVLQEDLDAAVSIRQYLCGNQPGWWLILIKTNPPQSVNVVNDASLCEFLHPFPIHMAPVCQPSATAQFGTDVGLGMAESYRQLKAAQRQCVPAWDGQG